MGRESTLTFTLNTDPYSSLMSKKWSLTSRNIFCAMGHIADQMVVLQGSFNAHTQNLF